MNFSSKLIEDGVNAFSSLPGIGKKTALRLVLHLIQQDKAATEEIAESLVKMVRNIKICKICFNISDHDTCNICSDKRRDASIVCVVESVREVMAIEDTAQFRGVYHVLGGVISPIDGVGPQDLHIQPLLERVTNQGVKELVMALTPTIEGDATIYYLSKKLADAPIKLSTLARGIAFGGELEYADEITLGRSIVARIPYKLEN